MNTYTRQFGVALIVLALVGCTNQANPMSAVTRPSQNVAPSMTASPTLDPLPTMLVANPNSIGSIQPAKAMHIERAAHAATLLDNEIGRAHV